jgi:hypothetical protein
MVMPPPLLVVLQSSAEEQGEATPPLGQWPLQRPVAEGSGPHDGCSSSALVGARPRLQPCWQISLSLSLSLSTLSPSRMRDGGQTSGSISLLSCASEG